MEHTFLYTTVTPTPKEKGISMYDRGHTREWVGEEDDNDDDEETREDERRQRKIDQGDGLQMQGKAG